MLYQISVALKLGDATSEHSEYSPVTLGNGAKVSVRVANHHGNALLFLSAWK